MKEGNTETLIFGQDTKEIDEDVSKKVETTEEKTDDLNGKKPEEKKETSTQKKEEPKKETENKSEEEAKKETTKETKEKEAEEQKPAFTVDFGKTKEAPKVDDTKKTEATQGVTEKEVLSFLKEKHGLEIESISDVSKKESLDDEVVKFQNYKKETGRGLNDFYNLQKDWNKESKESRITSYLKETNPNLSEEDIQTQLELLSVSEEDEAELSPTELKSKKLEFNKTDAKALSYLAEKSKEYRVPLESVAKPQPTRSKEDIAKAYQPYWDSRDSSLNELEDIKFNIDGLGEINLSVEESDKKLISQNTQTEQDFVNRWKEDDTLNTKNLVVDTLWSQESSRQKFIQQIVEQTHALALENFSKENRNVDLDKAKIETEKLNNSGLIIEGSNKSEKDQKFGKALI